MGKPSSTDIAVAAIKRDVLAVCKMDQILKGGGVKLIEQQARTDPETRRVLGMWVEATKRDEPDTEDGRNQDVKRQQGKLTPRGLRPRSPGVDE